MIQFLRKHARLLFFSILALIVIAGYFNFFVLRPFNLGCEPDPPPVDIVVDTWSKPLTEAGFKPAEIVKPVHIPDGKIPAGEPVLYGHGTVAISEPAESLEVEVIGVETPDGGKWLRVTVQGKPVHFTELQWLRDPVASDDRSDFSLLLECANVDGPDFGIGASWQPVHVFGADMGPAVTVDINRDLYDSPDWASASVRASKDYGPFTFGPEVGYRIGESSGLHLGVAVGVRLGL